MPSYTDSRRTSSDSTSSLPLVTCTLADFESERKLKPVDGLTNERTSLCWHRDEIHRKRRETLCANDIKPLKTAAETVCNSEAFTKWSDKDKDELKDRLNWYIDYNFVRFVRLPDPESIVGDILGTRAGLESYIQALQPFIQAFHQQGSVRVTQLERVLCNAAS